MSVQSLSKSVVGQGCVGACGSTVTVPYIVTDKGTTKITVKTVETSLCPNTGAFAFVFRNGKLVDQGIITELGSTLMTKAEKGDNIVVFATLFPLFNGIVCVWSDSHRFVERLGAVSPLFGAGLFQVG